MQRRMPGEVGAAEATATCQRQPSVEPVQTLGMLPELVVGMGASVGRGASIGLDPQRAIGELGGAPEISLLHPGEGKQPREPPVVPVQRFEFIEAMPGINRALIGA